MIDKRIILTLLQALIVMMNGFSQAIKDEVEESIAEQEMPEAALALLSPLLNEASAIRFYRETDNQQRSYECKMIWRGNDYSIEFHEDGSLMDIEQLVSFRSLSPVLREKINKHLSQEYRRFKIRKVQKQYSAEETNEADKEAIEEFMEKDQDDLRIRYEIEVDIKSREAVGSFEMLWDDEGNFLEKRKIIRRSLDNLLY